MRNIIKILIILISVQAAGQGTVYTSPNAESLGTKYQRIDNNTDSIYNVAYSAYEV